jgi:hypothetical protein
MGKLKKNIWVSLTGISGLLLSLAGFNLIELSPELVKYTGLSLLALSLIFWVLPDGRREVLK